MHLCGRLFALWTECRLDVLAFSSTAQRITTTKNPCSNCVTEVTWSYTYATYGVDVEWVFIQFGASLVSPSFSLIEDDELGLKNVAWLLHVKHLPTLTGCDRSIGVQRIRCNQWVENARKTQSSRGNSLLTLALRVVPSRRVSSTYNVRFAVPTITWKFYLQQRWNRASTQKRNPC